MLGETCAQLHLGYLFQSCRNHDSVLIIAGICDQNTSYSNDSRAKWNAIVSLDECEMFCERYDQCVWRMTKFPPILGGNCSTSCAAPSPLLLVCAVQGSVSQ